MIPAGKLKDRIVIEQRTSAVDGIGQLVETWSILVTLWGEVRYPSGLSTIKADADVALKKASIRIRYRTDISEAHRARHDSTLFDIKAVLPNRSEGYVDLVCEVIS